MKKMVLFVSALLAAASGYAEINDSLKVENVCRKSRTGNNYRVEQSLHGKD